MGMRFLASQAACKSIGAVTQRQCRFCNFFAGVLIDGLIVLEAPAHRGSRYIEEPRYIVNGYIFLSTMFLGHTNKDIFEFKKCNRLQFYKNVLYICFRIVVI